MKGIRHGLIEMNQFYYESVINLIHVLDFISAPGPVKQPGAEWGPVSVYMSLFAWKESIIKE